MPADRTNPVANPTWYADIRGLFTTADITHMRNQGIDLSLYEVVQANAMNIYSQVASGAMPPPPAGTTGPNPNAWPPAWATTFLNWMTNGCPKGSPAITARAAAVPANRASRIRKDLAIVAADKNELDVLKRAFAGIMAKGVQDPNSYFAQAGIHWLPGTGTPPAFYCQHHVPGYNPWHRAYLLSFENALRAIPGCENVTLPYWDITTPFPDVLKSPPFDSYTLPANIGQGFNAGYVTQRYPYAQIATNLLQYAVTDKINNALTKTDWEDFHGYWANAPFNTIIAAHDAGHVSIGPTMALQSVAAFDPAFWFFHSNWDRVFWKWQQQMDAISLNGLLSTINKTTDPLSYQIFTNPLLETLPPFSSSPLNLTTLAIIDSVNSLGVDYQDNPIRPMMMNFRTKTLRSVLASTKFEVQPNRVNVRVQGLNRLKIPGSFSVHLLRDGQPIASSALFQPNEAEKCETCVQNAIAHFDFDLPLSEVSHGRLGIWVEPVDKHVFGDQMPQKLMGNPTVEVQLLLTTE